ncbi:MAG: PrsW family intramembrane metalloprotease [Lachnospiraceae bacterium]|nr:PrsW family intramembrane metalloprotease [Lachnospiraceae bacterium]
MKKKTGEPFSKKAVAKYLIFGMLSALLTMLIQSIFSLERDTFFDLNPIVAGFVTALLTAALIEEVAKYILFRLALIKDKETFTWLDAIIVSIIVGAGFMIFENITKLVSGGANLLGAILPMHLLFQAVMGYYYGKARVTKKIKYDVLSLTIPIVLHTLFDMFLIGIMSILPPDRTIPEDYKTSLEQGEYIIPLFACSIVTTVVMFVMLIMSFKKISTWSKNGEKQDLLKEIPAEEKPAEEKPTTEE